MKEQYLDIMEKALAAYRAGIRTIIIPEDNERDICDIDETIRNEIKFVRVSNVSKVLKTALEN